MNITPFAMPSVLRKILPVVLGAGAGFAYWYFIGCATGQCPITSTWYISTGYGALVGASWLLPSPARKQAKPKDATTTDIHS